jgi:xanthine dehydrogenase accessory factor
MAGNSVQNLLEQVVGRAAAGEVVALCTVVGSRGSTPQAAGARMVVLRDGTTLGTLGGGCVEADVRQRALAALSSGKSELATFKLDHDYGWDDGLICGGTMEIFVEVLADSASAKKYENALRDLRAGRSAEIALEFSRDAKPATFAERIDPPAKLLIVGAGHVGQALANLAGALDFEITVIDDREDCASAARFPTSKRIVGEIEAELARVAIDQQTYVVIVTRGHRHDGRALAAVIDSPARYIGLIGSKRKVKTIFDDLLSQGVSVDRLTRVHAPIGLEIAAVSVNEIAVSIAAELIAVRRGRENLPAGPMKFDVSKLREMMESKL